MNHRYVDSRNQHWTMELSMLWNLLPPPVEATQGGLFQSSVRLSCEAPKIRPSNRGRPTSALISVVLPTFNEYAVLQRLTESLLRVLCHIGHNFEIIYINDGSSDGSDELLDAIAARDSRIKILHLSRNFGHQAALLAGLRASTGDAVIIMDSDMQDDPGSIPDMIAQWELGYDVVYAVRRARKEGLIKRALFYAFYRILRLVSNTAIPVDAGNFGLIDRRVARQVAKMPERARFFAGLRSWVGYRQIGIAVTRNARHDERPRVSFIGLIRLAKTAIFSFSTAPLIAFYSIAAASCCVCIGISGFALYHKAVTGLAVPGWTSEVIAASFFGMLNALGVAVLGEYVVAIFEQVRERPEYIIERSVNHPVIGDSRPPDSNGADPSRNL